MKQYLLWSVLFFATVPLQSFVPQLESGSVQRELDALTKRGFAYRLLDNNLIEITDPVSSEKHLKSLREPSEAQIRVWAQSRGVPILEIDPTQVDTNQYAGWYTHWTEVPLSNSWVGPLVVDDFDKNGNAEVYGAYRDFASPNVESRVYEIDSSGQSHLVHNYSPYVGASRFESDVDADSLKEIMFFFGGVFTSFEQVSTTELPIRFNFQHDSWQGDLDPGPSKGLVGLFDQDSVVDFLYKGSEPDSSDTTIGVGKEYVAEFNADSNNFVRVWSKQFVPGQQSTTSGFAVEDFNRNGKMEFTVTEGLRGRVFFAENNGDNNYAQVWQDSTPFVNLYYQTSGEVDGDVWPEFFVAATMSNGTWVLVYEANGNNSYSLKFLFRLLSGGTFDDPTLLTSDIDGDGKKELIIMSGTYLMMFKSNANDEYYLWYLKREDTKDAVQIYDFDRNGKQDFIISKFVLDSLNRGRFKADVYLATGIVSVPDDHALPLGLQLQGGYPNPFNSNTKISYSLPTTQRVVLRVYDLLGREAALLVNDMQAVGEHEITWNASNFTSGIYFCRMETQSSILTIKLLLLK